MDRKSKRFHVSRWAEILIPILLVLLVLGLLAVFAILLFSSFSSTASFSPTAAQDFSLRGV